MIKLPQVSRRMITPVAGNRKNVIAVKYEKRKV